MFAEKSIFCNRFQINIFVLVFVQNDVISDKKKNISWHAQARAGTRRHAQTPDRSERRMECPLTAHSRMECRAPFLVVEGRGGPRAPPLPREGVVLLAQALLRLAPVAQAQVRGAGGLHRRVSGHRVGAQVGLYVCN